MGPGPPFAVIAKNRCKLRGPRGLMGQAFGSRTPQPTGARPSLHAIAVPLGKAGNGEHIGDAPRAADVLRRPGTARRLQHDGPSRISDQKTVVVSEAPIFVSAAASLSVGFEQSDNRVGSRLSIGRPLE